MIESYKLFENVQQAKKLLKELNIPEDNDKYIKLKNMLNRNMGYLGTFTKWIFKDHESLEKAEEVYKMLSDIQIDKQINEFDKLENLYDYIQNFEINQKVNQIIKSLPSRTRQLVSDNLRDLLSLNIQHTKAIKDFYSKKGGRYKDSNSLFKDTKDYIKNLEGDFNLEGILKKFQDLGLKVIYERDYDSRESLDRAIQQDKVDIVIVDESPEVLLARIVNYNASCKVGSKHWCITTSEHMFNSYVNEFTNQYFIWDFTKDISDKRHMIGATISPGDNISNAHWADDSAVRDMSVFDEL